MSQPHLHLMRHTIFSILGTLLVVSLLAFIISQFSKPPTNNVSLFTSGLAVLLSSLLSAAWIVPLAWQVALSINKERSRLTWNILLVAPFTTSTILLVKAAAAVRPVWKHILTLLFLVSLPGIAVAVFMIITGSVYFSGEILSIPILILVGVFSIIVERLQEIALAVVVGMMIAIVTNARSTALFYAVIGGLLIRFIQMMVVLFLIRSLTVVVATNFAWLNALTGSTVLLIAMPYASTVLLLAGLIIGRELLIRWLFQWVIRHAALE